ncbi:hypothetical protein PF004_g28595, partial [Phytophthora fragariae]
EIFKDVNLLMAKIPRDHALATENFVQVAARLMVIEAQVKARNEQIEVSDSCLALTTPKLKPSGCLEGPYVPKMKDVSMSRKWISSQTARVFPFNPLNRYRKKPTNTGNDLELETLFTTAERSMFIRKTKHVLFIAEYLVLVEYVEVVLPFVYCIHELILFHMHNGAYYPAVAGISSDQQLAFVLDVHAGVVQTKLNLIFVYIMQVSLTHLGADFSFKFSWLNPHKD